MREIFLNTHQVGCEIPLRDFVEMQSPDTSVFCFQEVPSSKAGLFSNFLPGFGMHIDHKKFGNGCSYGQATLFQKHLSLLGSGRLLESKCVGFAIWTVFETGGQKLTVVNVHGISRPKHKADNISRIRQSKTILNFLSKIDGAKIIGGDFNLNPDTKSIKMFEEAGYRNLIKDFKIETTRNHLAWDKFPHPQYFADYIFVSPEVRINNFEVPNIEVSDHLPLILDVEI